MQRDKLTADNALVQRIADVLLEGLGDDIGFDGLESELMRTFCKAGQRVLIDVLGRADREDAFVERGVTWRPAGRSNLVFHSVFGRVEMHRHIFRDRRNGPTRCLVSEKAGLVGRLTPKAMRVSVRALTDMTSYAAEEFFDELGVLGLGRSSLQRFMHMVGAAWEDDRENIEAELRQAAEIPEEAHSVMVSLDGVMVLLNSSDKATKQAAARSRGQIAKGPSGWKEASVGVLSFFDEQGQRLATRRYGRMPEPNMPTTKSWLAAELQTIRAQRPDLVTIGIADGAVKNWTFLDTLDLDWQLVDYFHTVEHLHRHISRANGASTLETQEILQRARRRLRDEPDAASAVFGEMQRLREKAGTEAPSTRKQQGKRQPTFVERHLHRMDYPGAQAANLPIGSGVTESTCKLLVCDRLRRTGMRWSQAGGQAILTFRAALHSGRMDEALDAVQQRMAA